MMDMDTWIKRADDVLAKASSVHNASEQMQFATSILATFYGPESPQMKTFRDTADGILKSKPAIEHHLQMHACATIRNVQAELKAGLIQNIRALIAGENIAELLAIAKDALGSNSEAGKNVAAVLVAAAFEELMRRMGTEFARVTGRPSLQDVITTLKQNDVLKGGEPTTALSYLKFRNDSLHADWSNVERSQIHSCLSFIEQLLLKHLS
jgi:hypothetical protein